MTSRPLLGSAAEVIALSERLRQCPEVSRLDEEDHDEASTLAHAFADLEESFGRFLNELLPQLLREAPNASAVLDILTDIGDEFRHILYHLRDPKFYDYLREDGDTAAPAQ